MYTFTRLEIPGYAGFKIPNSLIRQEEETRHLAIIYPGLGYNASMPLLHYTARILTGRGADVLRVEYDYTRPEYTALPQDERDRWFYADVNAAWRVALSRRPYEQVTLVGKSLGTLALGHLLAEAADVPHLRSIWLTPILRHELLYAQMMQIRHPAFLAIGTADHYYDPALLATLQKATGCEIMVLDGAKHSLECEDDILKSIDLLGRIMRAVQAFVARGSAVE